MIFWRWIYPGRYGAVETPTLWMTLAVIGFLAAAIAFCIIFMFLTGNRRKPFPVPAIGIWTFLLFIVGYLLFVVLTISLFDASVNIEERILFPAFMIFWMILPILFGWLLHEREYLPAILPLALLVFFSAIFVQDTLKHLPQMAESGYGWGWEGWKDSPAMNIIRELPEEKVIYTNQIEAVSLWADRGAYALLDPIDPSSNREREGYRDTFNEIRRQVYEGESVMVFFGISDWIGDTQDNWVTQICEGMPFIYQDESEWVVGK